MAGMELNVIATGAARSGESLWRVFLDLESDWAGAIGETIDTDAARFIVNRELPTVWDANRVFLAGSRTDAAEWLEEVLRDAALHTIRPIVWDIDRLTVTARNAMRDELLRRKFREQGNPVQRLAQLVPCESGALNGLSVIPARAAQQLYADLCVEWIRADKHEPAMVASMSLHLDDPKFEGLLALHDGRPVAMAGLQSRGEAGRIEDVYVTPDHRRRGIGGAMVERVLDLAARAQLRDVFVVTSPFNVRARALYERIGFTPLGVYTVFVAPDAPTS